MSPHSKNQAERSSVPWRPDAETTTLKHSVPVTSPSPVSPAGDDGVLEYGGPTVPADDQSRSVPITADARFFGHREVVGEQRTRDPATAISWSLQTASRQGNLLLAHYVQWSPTPQPDPLVARRDELIAGLQSVVAAEGPVIAELAYRRLHHASGGQRMSERIRSAYDRARGSRRARRTYRRRQPVR